MTNALSELILKKITIAKWSIKLGVLLPALIAFLLYGAMTFNHGFVLDDNLVITSNEHVLDGFSGIPDLFKYNYGHGHEGFNDGLYRPLSLVTFAFEQALFGEINPSTSHLLQSLFYGLCVLVLSLWLFSLFPEKPMWAFWIATLFAIHPIHSEVAANLKGRDEILAILFFAAAAYKYLQWMNTNSTKHLILGMVWMLAASFSKESALTFIVIFPLMHWYKSASLNTGKLVKGSVIMAIPSALFLIVRQSVLSGLKPVDTGVANLLQNSLIEIGGFAERTATAATIQGLYIQKLFIPINLSHDYSYNAIEVVGLSDVFGLLWIAVNLGLIILGFYGLVKKQWWSFGILFYYATIAVVANFFILIGAIAAERFVFTPSLGWCIAIVAALFGLKMKDNTRTMVLSSLCIAFIALSAYRIPDWKSNYTLFTTDVDRVPTSARAHYNAGSTMIDEAKVNPKEARALREGAREHLREATRIWPEYQDAYNNLGISYMNEEMYDEARAEYLDFIKRFPRYSKARYNLAVTCHLMKKYDEAEEHFESFLAASPQHNNALYYAAECEGYQQKFNEAIEHLEKLVKLEPTNERGYLKLGMAYGIIQNSNLAEKNLLNAIELAPNNSDAHFNLAVFYTTINDIPRARAEAQTCLKIDPKNQNALGLLQNLPE